jgi:hypothetical protein
MLIKNKSPFVWERPLVAVQAVPSVPNNASRNKENRHPQKRACVCQLDWCGEAQRLHPSTSYLKLSAEPAIRTVPRGVGSK